VSEYPWSAALTNLAVTAAVVLLTFLVTLFVAVRVRGGRHDGIDTVWGAGFAIIALTTLVLAVGDGDLWRQLLITVLTCVWGLRLAWHITARNRGTGEDPRYVEIMDKAPGNPVLHMVRKVYLPQAVIMWVVSLPVQLGQYGFADGPLSLIVTALGVLCWAVGFTFETVGDAQLAAFKADPANKGQVMDRGLWRYTRHPNYFGDAAVWWGLTLLGLHHAAGLIGLVGAGLMTWLLAKGTGAKLLESTIGDRRPGYADYVRRTSGFFPLPAKKVATSEGDQLNRSSGSTEGHS
jgi:steroid 5-alpha reductase family enzyme